MEHPSPKVQNKVFSACEWPAMLHGCETWAQNIANTQQLHHNDHAMVCWIFGTNHEEEILLATVHR